MTGFRSVRIVVAAGLSALALASLPASAAAAPLSTAKKAEIRAVGADAYTYGYAPVYMERNVARFPAKTVINVQYLATDLTRSIVLPNADTLYTLMVLNVASSPVIIHTPPTGSRYFGLELLDGYTNVFGYIGTRATGSAGGNYAVVGPGWTSKKAPLNRRVDGIIRSSTPRVWVIGRTLVDGPTDLAAAKAVQDGITAQFANQVKKGKFLGRVNLASATVTGSAQTMTPDKGFFKEFAAVTKAQPPLRADASLMRRLAKYGVGPGRDPSRSQSSAVMTELLAGAASAQATITASLEAQRIASAAKRNGWILFDKVGTYGTDYATRAVIAEFGLGANRPEEAVYPAATADSAGNPLNGAGGAAYRIHFPAGQTPPNDAFWSISMYAEDKYFIPNSIGRFAIGDRTPGLVTNPDGSLDIYLSAAQPGVGQHGAANWLPAPTGKFTVVLRVYRPKADLISDVWQYPQIDRLP